MLFNSFEFIFLFLPVVFGVFVWITRTSMRRLSTWWLVAASMFYYGWWNPEFLWVILISIVGNYSLSIAMLQVRPGGKRATLMVGAGIALNLTGLAYFKYTDFLWGIMAPPVGRENFVDTVILPLGISFFTFQQIAFLVDTFKGYQREHSFGHYCLFVTFFPQLIAGPIVHHKEMMPQFDRVSTGVHLHTDVAVGLTFIVAGLFKKVVIADRLALWANPIFASADAGEMPGAYMAWIGALSYTFQIYFDFSGYTDMAIGSARLFGIRLPQNFASPYQANSIIDFWRRWHMTLSRFLRDYLYIPLGGGHRGTPRRYFNLMVTMVLGGLWHGAGWSFVFWGALHGMYLTINHFWRYLVATGRLGDRPHTIARSAAGAFLGRTLTFLAVVVAWVFFRAETFSGGVNILSGMIGANGTHLGANDMVIGNGAATGAWKESVFLAGLLVFTWVAPSVSQVMMRYRPVIQPQVKWKLLGSDMGVLWRPTYLWAFAVGAVGVVSIYRMMTFGFSEFIYRFF